jgi:deazaflavin-dependent oxidoreductase (nitroreductase family)
MNGNNFMTFILRSPLHGMLSSSTMLITVTGCKTGKAITTPVNYALDGNKVWVTSYRKRSWWRNLRGGQPVTLRVKGKEVNGWGNVIEDGRGVEKALGVYLALLPQHAKYFHVTLDERSQPSAEELALAAHDRVIVEITI